MAIVVLHPAASSGKAVLQLGRWLEQADIAVCAPEGIVQYPDTAAHPVKNVRCWSSEEAACAGRHVDDLGFINEAIEQFVAKLPPGVPLCLVGHSNGCAMGFRVLGQASHPSQAAVLASATWAQPTDTVRRIPVLYMTGSEDPVFPHDFPRFVVTPWFSHFTEPATKPRQEWLRATGLDAAPPQGPVRNEQGLRTVWRGEGNCIFAFQLLEGQGHHWPARQPIPPEVEAIRGPNREDLCATSLALEFLREHA